MSTDNQEHAALSADANNFVTFSPEEEKALVKKIDRRMIPIVSMMYFLAYLDRVNLGNAKVANNENKSDTLEASLGLDNLQYNWAVAIFFVPYVIFEVPSNFMMRIAGPKIWLARIMVTWGIIATCQAFVSNFAGIMACRALLGAAEAGLFPGVIFFFSFWYRKHEISTRVAVLFSFNSLAAAFSGLLATALSQLNGRGGLKGWQWILILEGAPSIIIGVIAFVTLPNFPQNSKFFLTPREEEIAIGRLPTTAASVTDKKFDTVEFLHSLRDPLLVLFCLASFFQVLPSYGTSYFRPSIISGLGFTGNLANLMSAFPSILTSIFDQFWGWHSDKVKERPMHILFSLSMNLIGSALLIAGQINLWAPGLRYFFMFIQAFSQSGLAITYVYRANTLKGSTAQATSTGLTIALGNIGGFVAPFAYPNSWGPLYINAIWISFAMTTGAIFCVVAIWAYEVRMKRMDPQWAKEMASDSEMSAREATEDLKTKNESDRLD
ncbi:MFS general substrate transporter [Gonapodya prolifera JEL478]|uniref:MFS general substrate transporter n=1 Tax=Gonapodya prolifera (strain JEL478) TaxID=1344416 RepID=A0A138ZYT2_GONPJ|nr:MFS general substrate transporter [Gonapodya prolifera JEL478]|eukprot:KXS09672.1 MFS general substrate transporter [Gonapodya prolifera JEL478]